MQQNTSKNDDSGVDGSADAALPSNHEIAALVGISNHEIAAMIGIRKLNFEVMRQRMINQFYINKWHRERSKTVANASK